MGPGRRAKRAVVRVDAGDPGHQEIAFTQVDGGGERQGQCRGCSVGLAHAGDQQADPFGIAADRRILGGQPRHADFSLEFEAFDPVLCLGGEHRDQHHFGLKRRRGPGSRAEQGRAGQAD